MNGEGRLSRPKLRFERDFTQLPNAWLRDDELSLKARGLLAMLMSHDAGWNVTIKSLAATNPEGLDAIRTAVRELEERGYLDREQTRQNGRLGHVWWTLTDPAERAEAERVAQLDFELDWQKSRSAPRSDYPVSENPTTEEPSPENPTTKEEHLKEHLPIEVKNPTIGARANEEDALPRDSHSVAPESPAERYRRLIQEKCPGRRAGKSHVWLASSYCEWCGHRRPELEDEQELTLTGAVT